MCRVSDSRRAHLRGHVLQPRRLVAAAAAAIAATAVWSIRVGPIPYSLVLPLSLTAELLPPLARAAATAVLTRPLLQCRALLGAPMPCDAAGQRPRQPLLRLKRGLRSLYERRLRPELLQVTQREMIYSCCAADDMMRHPSLGGKRIAYGSTAR